GLGRRVFGEVLMVAPDPLRSLVENLNLRQQLVRDILLLEGEDVVLQLRHFAGDFSSLFRRRGEPRVRRILGREHILAFRPRATGQSACYHQPSSSCHSSSRMITYSIRICVYRWNAFRLKISPGSNTMGLGPGSPGRTFDRLEASGN